MLKGISVWAFAPNRPLDEVFKLAKETGFQAVEVAIADDGPITPQSSEADCKRILELADAAGIKVSGLASGMGWKYPLTSQDEAKRRRGIEATKASLRVAQWLETDTILLVPGIVDASTPYDVAYENATNAIHEIMPVAQETGVTLGIENVWNKFLLSPLEMRDFVAQFGDGCGAYFDVGNVLAFGFPEHWIPILNRQICRIHFKDFKREVGTLAGFCPLLEGDVDFPAVMNALRKIGYDGDVVSEFGNCEDNLRDISQAMDKILAM